MTILCVLSVASTTTSANSFALSDSIVTILSVLAGGILTLVTTLITDRVSWSKRKKEQIRERQLGALTDTVLVIQDAYSLIEDIYNSGTEYQSKIETTLSDAVKESIVEQRKDHLLSSISKLENQYNNVRRSAITLELLGYMSSSLEIINDCILFVFNKFLEYKKTDQISVVDFSENDLIAYNRKISYVLECCLEGISQ